MECAPWRTPPDFGIVSAKVALQIVALDRQVVESTKRGFAFCEKSSLACVATTAENVFFVLADFKRRAELFLD